MTAIERSCNMQLIARLLSFFVHFAQTMLKNLPLCYNSFGLRKTAKCCILSVGKNALFTADLQTSIPNRKYAKATVPDFTNSDCFSDFGRIREEFRFFNSGFQFVVKCNNPFHSFSIANLGYKE